jgi:predicted alpha/beta hydrolase family esterase
LSATRLAWPPVLILPGLGDSGPAHWQSRREHTHPTFRRVQQREWDHPDCAEWVDTLDAAIRDCAEPPLLIAHSTACCMVARWAAQHVPQVRGALLVAPSDSEASSYPAGPTGFQPMPLHKLDFPAIVVASSDDPYVSIERARQFAQSWGAQIVEIGAHGHINGDSGLGDWPEGLMLARELALLD